MADMMASLWVEESEDPNKMNVTIAIEGTGTEVYLMDRNMWDTVEAGIRNGSLFSRWFSKPAPNSSVKAAKGMVNDRELDVQ